MVAAAGITAGITAETVVETIAATVAGTTAKETTAAVAAAAPAGNPAEIRTAVAAVTPMKAADAHRRARQSKTGMRIAVAI